MIESSAKVRREHHEEHMKKYKSQFQKNSEEKTYTDSLTSSDYQQRIQQLLDRNNAEKTAFTNTIQRMRNTAEKHLQQLQNSRLNASEKSVIEQETKS